MIRLRVQLGVWVALVAATALQLLLGEDTLRLGERSTGLSIVLVATVKARCVGLYFMELDRAPRLLRWAFTGYLCVLVCVLGGLFLAAS